MAFSISGWLSNDIGIDLGTANTLVYVKGQGIVVNEPSIVALDRNTGKPIAIGGQAKEMLGRENPDIEVVRPLRDGVIADYDVTEEMLRYFIKKVQKNKLLVRPRIVICIPSGVSAVEMRAVRESAEMHKELKKASGFHWRPVLAQRDILHVPFRLCRPSSARSAP